MKKISVIVATHKKYQMPTDSLYIPVQVGAEGKDDLGYTRDNTGDNISTKNPFFCELTGLYWAWKNLDADYIGLAHYRRHFGLKKKKYKRVEDTLDHILTRKQAKELLKDTDVILPKKRRYYIENLYNHYKHTMHIETLDETRNIIEEKYPEYLPEFDKLHKRTSMHAFNMMIMKRDILDGYCKWLFDILFELEKRIDATKYDAFHARFYGRVSERLLDVYLNTNNIKYKEIPFIEVEHINWIKKGFGFLFAKFFGKKYGKSC